MQVTVDLQGLAPGRHGFHIHSEGDCSAPDASSAGGHFDPTDMPHGAPTDGKHHIGDLGNITASDEGIVQTTLSFADLTFSGENSILGRAVVIHASADDLETRPAGDAGARVACGVIRRS